MNREEWEDNSYLAGLNAPYIEELYDAYLEDPTMVDPKWQTYFSSLQINGAVGDVCHDAVKADMRERAKHWRRSMLAAPAAAEDQQSNSTPFVVMAIIQHI